MINMLGNQEKDYIEQHTRTVTLGYNAVYRPQNYKVTRKDYYVTINYRGKKEKIEIKHPFMTNGKLQKIWWFSLKK